jgi:hypothetical protein
LEVLLVGYEVASPSILAVWPPSRHVSGKVRAFVDLLAMRFGKTPYWDKLLFDGIENQHPIPRNMIPPQQLDSRAH